MKEYKSVVILQTEKYIYTFIIIKNIKKCQSTSPEERLNYLSILSIEDDITKYCYVKKLSKYHAGRKKV